MSAGLPIISTEVILFPFGVYTQVMGRQFKTAPFFAFGPGSSVGIATGYRLDGPRIESDGGEIFRTRPDRPWGPPSLLYNE
jgi:hypothetical protein